VKTIEERWFDFRARCISSRASEVELHTLRIVFYAGFKAMLDFNMEIALLDDEPAVLELEKINMEARRFGASL
jgi:hypothetical protein